MLRDGEIELEELCGMTDLLADCKPSESALPAPLRLFGSSKLAPTSKCAIFQSPAMIQLAAIRASITSALALRGQLSRGIRSAGSTMPRVTKS